MPPLIMKCFFYLFNTFSNVFFYQIGRNLEKSVPCICRFSEYVAMSTLIMNCFQYFSNILLDVFFSFEMIYPWPKGIHVSFNSQCML